VSAGDEKQVVTGDPKHHPAGRTHHPRGRRLPAPDALPRPRRSHPPRWRRVMSAGGARRGSRHRAGGPTGGSRLVRATDPQPVGLDLVEQLSRLL